MGPLRVRCRDRTLFALDPEDAIVPRQVDPVVGRQAGEEVAARVNGPVKPGLKGTP